MRRFHEHPADLGKPRGINLYTYANNNPVNFTDPDGGGGWYSAVNFVNNNSITSRASAGAYGVLQGLYNVAYGTVTAPVTIIMGLHDAAVMLSKIDWSRATLELLLCKIGVGWEDFLSMSPDMQARAIGQAVTEIGFALDAAAKSGGGAGEELSGLERSAEEASKIRGACFAAGTVVETENGPEAIENIQVGERVLAYNEDTDEQGYYEVERTFIRQSDHLLDLYLSDGTEIQTTAEHPFYSNGEWVPAGELWVGDTLQSAVGEGPSVAGIERVEGFVEVYNLRVAEAHTYYVGESGVLVHNTYKKGSYTIEFESGKQYHGKGDPNRVGQSAKRIAEFYEDPVKSMEWTPAENDREAFIQEHLRIIGQNKRLGVDNPMNYNEINSPGKRYFEEDL